MFSHDSWHAASQSVVSMTFPMPSNNPSHQTPVMISSQSDLSCISENAGRYAEARLTEMVSLHQPHVQSAPPISGCILLTKWNIPSPEVPQLPGAEYMNH
jgi:hypothetical protein